MIIFIHQQGSQYPLRRTAWIVVVLLVVVVVIIIIIIIIIDELSLSEMLSAGAAFQRSFTIQQFAGL